MAGDIREIKVNVTVDSDTRGSEQAAAGLQKVDKAAGGAEHSLGDLRKESEKLDVQLAKSRTKVHELEAELARSGDRSSGRGSLRNRLNQERSWLRELERLAKSAEAVMPDLHLNVPKLDFSSLVSESRGGLITGLIGIAAMAAPGIGAVISGAVAGTVAGGGIAGGVIAASADSRVRLAFKDLASEFTSEAFGGGAFVQPVVAGIGILKDAFRDLNIDEALSKGAGSVTILAQGIGDLVTNFMPGFNAVMDQSTAFTTVFAEGLGDTGAALSDMLISMMSSEGTIEGLKAGFQALDAIIIGTGNTLEGLADAFHGITLTAAKFTGDMEDVTLVLEKVARATTQVLSLGMINLDDNHAMSDTFKVLNDHLEDTVSVGWQAKDVVAAVGGVLRESSGSAEDAADEMKRVNDEFERMIDREASLMLTNIAIEQGLQDMADQFAENGGAVNDFTDAGRDNETMLIRQAQRMRDSYNETTALTGATAASNAALEANHQRLLDQAEAAGASREAVEALIGALFRVPTLYGDIAGNRTYSQGTSGGEGRKAAGGYVSAGASYLVGENRAEVFTPKTNGYISPSVDSWAGGMGGVGGGGGSMELVIRSGGSAMDDLLVQILSRAVQNRGGDGAVLGIRTVAG